MRVSESHDRAPDQSFRLPQRPPRRSSTSVSTSAAMLHLQRAIGNAAVHRLVQGVAPVTSSAPAVERVIQRTKSRSKEWKNKKTQEALTAAKAAAPGNEFIQTLHHIIPKIELDGFARILDESQRQKVVAELRPYATSAFAQDMGVDAEAVGKALKNLPANFVLGPLPQNREDDPGRGPDYNYQNGTMTPRSQILEGVYEFITDKLTTGAAVTTAELDAEFIRPLVEASRKHNARLRAIRARDAVGLEWARASWTGDPSQGTARRAGPS